MLYLLKPFTCYNIYTRIDSTELEKKQKPSKNFPSNNSITTIYIFTLNNSHMTTVTQIYIINNN